VTGSPIPLLLTAFRSIVDSTGARKTRVDGARCRVLVAADTASPFFCSRPPVQLCAQPSTPLRGAPGACASILAAKGAVGSLLQHGNTSRDGLDGRRSLGRSTSSARHTPPQTVVPPPAAATARSGGTDRLTAISGTRRGALPRSAYGRYGVHHVQARCTHRQKKRRSEREPGRESCSRTGWTGADSVHPSVRERETEREEIPFRIICARLWPPRQQTKHEVLCEAIPTTGQ